MTDPIPIRLKRRALRDEQIRQDAARRTRDAALTPQDIYAAQWVLDDATRRIARLERELERLGAVVEG